MRQDFQQCALAGTIPTDDPDYVTSLHFKIDIFECPKVFATALTTRGQTFEWGLHGIDESFTQVPVLTLES